MNGFLDMRTLSLLTGLVVLFLAVPLFFISFQSKRYPGAASWAIGTLAAAFGLVLLSLRGLILPLFSILLGNLLMATQAVLVSRGLAAFVGEKQKRWPDIVAILALAVATQLFTVSWPNVNARIVVISAVIAVFSWRSFWLSWRKLPPLIEGRVLPLAASLGFFAAWFSVRVALTLSFEKRIIDFMSADLYQRTTLVVTLAFETWMVVSLIIASKQRLQCELRESEEKYRHLVQRAPAAIYEIDFRTGHYTQVNDVMCQMLGYSSQELLELSAFDILDEESKAHFRARVHEAESGTPPSHAVEYRARRKDGQYIWGLVNATFHWEKGTITT